MSPYAHHTPMTDTMDLSPALVGLAGLLPRGTVYETPRARAARRARRLNRSRTLADIKAGLVYSGIAWLAATGAGYAALQWLGVA